MKQTNPVFGKIVVPENIHTHLMNGHCKFLGVGVLKAKSFKGKYEAKPEFSKGWKGGGSNPKKSFVVGVTLRFCCTPPCSLFFSAFE